MAKFTRETARLAAISMHMKRGHKLSPSSNSYYTQSKIKIRESFKHLPSLVRYFFVVDYKKGEHPIYFEAYWVGFDSDMENFKEKCNDFMENIDEGISKAFEKIGVRVGVSHPRGELKHGDTSVNLDNRLRRYRLDTKWKEAM